jgi:hypothetical protein
LAYLRRHSGDQGENYFKLSYDMVAGDSENPAFAILVLNLVKLKGHWGLDSA